MVRWRVPHTGSRRIRTRFGDHQPAVSSISPENRDVIDPRLKTLNEQRHALEARLDELDRLIASQTEILTVVSDTMRFLAALPFTLREGVPQEKLGALRQCVERVTVGSSREDLKVGLSEIPSSGCEATKQLATRL